MAIFPEEIERALEMSKQAAGGIANEQQNRYEGLIC
jgi:hypothetical protein